MFKYIFWVYDDDTVSYVYIANVSENRVTFISKVRDVLPI
jgi:hypothetical protein